MADVTLRVLRARLLDFVTAHLRDALLTSFALITLATLFALMVL